MREKRFRYWTFVLIEAALLVALNILARTPKVCDWYANHIFGIWSETYARLTGLAPFSVGEIMIFVAIGFVIAAVIGLILLIFLFKKKKYRRSYFGYLRFLLVFVMTVGIIITLNLSFLYKTEKMSINGNREKQYTTKELETLRNYVVEQVNVLSEEMARDEFGYITLGGKEDALTKEEVQVLIKDALRNRTDLFPRLDGYYPNVKTLLCTDFMYYIYTTGVYYPHTMEANMSELVDTSWYAYTAAHELSHLKGYIYEDEANFVAFATLVNTDDAFLKYSAYLGVYNHVNNDYWSSINNAEYYLTQPQISAKVRKDNCCYRQEDIDRMEKKKEEAVFNPQVVTDISVDVTQGYLDFYESTANYDEVTKLLLQYYDGILY